MSPTTAFSFTGIAIVLILLGILFVAFVIFIVVVLLRITKSNRTAQAHNFMQGTGKTFAENLKEIRCNLNLSQEYVAEKIGVSRQAVSKWETGNSEPSTANLRALADLYSISLDELIKPNSF